MRLILAIVGGLLFAGIVMGATIPLLPESFRTPWYAGCVAGVSIAASLYVASRIARTPRD
jgi:hypothetical protein